MQADFPNIRHLRAMAEVARHRGISAAAAHVHLSQPAITQAIAKLEQDLGVRLFARLRDGMDPTAEGRVFLLRVERMLAELSRAVAEAQARQTGRRGRGFRQFDTLVTAAQLRALVALSRAGNFSLAARQTGLAQPTIHRAARDLEALAGFRMFRVTKEGVDLTPAARILARRAQLAAAEIRQGRFEIEAMKGRDSTRIVIGAMPLARSTILPAAIDRMLADHPDIQISTLEGPYETLLQGLRYGQSDFLVGALRTPIPTDDIEQEPLFEDRLEIVARAGHPLASRGPVGVRDTLAYPWIAPPKSTPSGQVLCAALGIDGLAKTPVRVVSSSLALLRGMLLEGDYLSIVSRRQIGHELALGALVVLPVELPQTPRPIGLTVRANWWPTPTQARFLGRLRDVARENAPLL